MRKKETLIVAVLVNAGLLMILFATATKTPKSSPNKNELVVEKVEKIEKKVMPAPTLENLAVQEIELDDLLFQEEPFEEEVVVQNEEPSCSSITVKQGDVLEKIARANQTSVQAIVDLNQLKSTQLSVGQVLKMPIKSAQELQEIKEIKELKEIQEEFYVVKEGDNPWLIASKNKVKLSELLRLNHLDDRSSKRLKPGDRLRIR